VLQGSISVIIALALAVVGILFVLWQIRNVLSEDTGTDRMREIASYIQEGAAAFLNREYLFLAVFVAIVATIIAFFLHMNTAISFVVGAVASGAAGYLGMFIAVRANVRTAAAAQRSLNDGLRVAFGSGSIMGMAVVNTSQALALGPVVLPSLPASVVASIQKQPMWVLTSWVKSSRGFQKMILATQPLSLTTWVITSVTLLVWVPTSLKATAVLSSLRPH